jgi:SAM-dependent methyltransferase
VDTTGRRSEGQALVVNGAVNALAEALAKRWESTIAREQRFESRVAGLSAAHEELRSLISISQQAAMTMKRELERFIQTPNSQQPTPNSPLPTSDLRPPTSGAFAPALDAYKYVGFEDQFRGSQETIRARLESYLPYFDGASDVLDVGCGRGEFLDLLKARGIGARGLDLNHEMVEVCRARGLEVAEADVVSYLERLPDGSLGGLFAAQVVEHLQPAYLLRFLDVAYHKLRPGAPIVLETLNPACWTAFFDSFIRDITHVWPLHPETLRYLVLASGFSAARIEFRSPVAPQDRLQAVAATDRGHLATDHGNPATDHTDYTDLLETFNANVEKLNARMFSFLDYAIVGGR